MGHTPKTNVQRQQKQLLSQYRHNEELLKWVIVVAITAILLLLLLLGFATDWGRGLHKDSVNMPVTTGGGSGTLNSETADAAPAAKTSGGGGSSTSSTTGTGTTHTDSTTTNTTSTTTTNNGTTQPNSGPLQTLLNFYNGTSVGDNIKDVLKQANGLGIATDCHTDIVIQTCTFDQNGATVTTKDIAGTGIITSVTKGF